eukprot:9324843-Alexandrium_andersonii.AAC.1
MRACTRTSIDKEERNQTETRAGQQKTAPANKTTHLPVHGRVVAAMMRSAARVRTYVLNVMFPLEWPSYDRGSSGKVFGRQTRRRALRHGED